MKQILVGKDVAYAKIIGSSSEVTIQQVNQLDAGAIAVFALKNQKYSLVDKTTPATALQDASAIIVAVGSGDATLGAYTSMNIPRWETNIEWLNYSAAIKQIWVVGGDNVATGALNLPTLTKGLEAQIRVVDLSTPGYTVLNTKRYSYVVKTGDTAAEVLTGLYNAIVADTNAIVTPTVLGTTVGLKLEAKVATTVFTVTAGDGILLNSTILTQATAVTTVPKAPFAGFGGSAQLTAVESDFFTNRGDSKSELLPTSFFSKASDIVSGTNYNGIIMWFNAPGMKHLEQRKVIIVYPTNPSAGTFGAVASTIFTEAFGSTTADIEIGASTS